MLRGLMKVPNHFQYILQSIPYREPCSHLLPIVVSLNYIAVYGDTQEQVLDYTLDAIKHLVLAGFMLYL